MFHQPRQDVLRLENAEDSSGRRGSKMNPSLRYYVYIYIYIRLWSRSIPTRTREWCKGAAKRGLGPEEEAESGLALRGIPRVNAPWMNDEPWGRGGFLLSSPPSPPTNRIRIGFRSRPKSRLDSRVVVDQDTDPYYTFSPSSGVVQGDLDRVSRQVFWKFSKMDIRIGRYFLIFPRKVVTGKCFDSFCKEFRKIEKQFVKEENFNGRYVCEYEILLERSE